jgi:hypothetical protein
LATDLFVVDTIGLNQLAISDIWLLTSGTT